MILAKELKNYCLQIALFLISIVLISGCSSAPPYQPVKEIPQDKGLLYVYNYSLIPRGHGPLRSSNATLFCRFTVSQDGTNSDYEVNAMEYAPIMLNPGKCDIYISMFIVFSKDTSQTSYKMSTYTYRKKINSIIIEKNMTKYLEFTYNYNSNEISANFVAKDRALPILIDTVQGKNIANYPIQKEPGRLSLFQILKFPITTDIVSVAFSPDGKYVLSGDANHLTLWDAKSSREIRQFFSNIPSIEGSTYFYNHVAFTPDGKYVIANLYNGICKWDITNGKVVNNFSPHSQHIYSAAVSPDGKYILSGEDKMAILLDITTGKEIFTFSGHSDSVEAVAFSTDSKYAITSDHTGMIKVWNVATGKEIQTFSGFFEYRLLSVAMSPDDKYVLAGGSDGTLLLLDISKGKKFKTLFDNSDYQITSVAFSPNGKYIMAGVYKTNAISTVKLWDSATYSEIFPIHVSKDYDTVPQDDAWYAWTDKFYSGWIQSLAFSPDGKNAIVGFDGGLVLLE